MTKARERIFDILNKSHKPLNAAFLYNAMHGAFDLATVYRTLQFLERELLAEGFTLSCKGHGTERYYLSSQNAHKHFFHCESCHDFFETGECMLLSVIESFEADTGFQVHSHTLYLSGICKNCQTAQEKKSSGKDQTEEKKTSCCKKKCCE